MLPNSISWHEYIKYLAKTMTMQLIGKSNTWIIPLWYYVSSGRVLDIISWFDKQVIRCYAWYDHTYGLYYTRLRLLDDFWLDAWMFEKANFKYCNKKEYLSQRCWIERRGQNDDKSQASISDVKGEKLNVIIDFILKMTKLCIEKEEVLGKK